MELLRTVRSAAMFPVADIMVPLSALIRGESSVDARAIFEQNPDIDLLPLPLAGAPTRVIYKRDMTAREIGVSMLISESTAIIDLPQLFVSRHEAFFILGEHSISGLVHYSDLNNPTCKIPFFALVEMVERKCIQKIRGGFNKERALPALGERSTHALLKRASDLAAESALPFPAAAMFFKELLRYCAFYELIDLAEHEIEQLNEFRNRVSHAGRVLIMRLQDCERLASAQRLCLRLLEIPSRS